MKKLQIVKDLIKRKVVDLARKFGRLYTAMDIVILTLKVRKLFPEPLIALELFGCHGLWVTADYAPFCSYLELWEINPECAKFANKYFSNLNCIIKIGDSIEAVKRKGLLRESYNFVVIDNPVWSPYGQGYYEHFDFFSDIFGYVGQKGVLIITVLFNMDTYATFLRKEETPQRWVDRRKEFYGMCEDKEVIKPDVKRMIDAYKNKIPKEEFNITDTFLVPRNLSLGYLVIVLERNSKKRRT